MQNTSHHGKIVQEYREQRIGFTQEELARRIGKSRRTIVTLEQLAYIDDTRLRRTLVWALQIPPTLLDLPEKTPLDVPLLYPIYEPEATAYKSLSHAILETFFDNLHMRLNLYYLSSSLEAEEGLDAHIELLEQRVVQSSLRDRRTLLTLLSNNYQIKGMIARDQFDQQTAKTYFDRASVVAQQGECSELIALAMGRQAIVELQQNQLNKASHLYEAAREIAKRSPAALRAYLAIGHAEVQGKIKDRGCLISLAEAYSLLDRIDKEDDPLLLFHSTRCTERAIHDCWAQCHAFIGESSIAIQYYEKLESRLDVTMLRMRARFHIQYARALYLSHHISCCAYLAEGIKLALATNSKHNLYQAQELLKQLTQAYPQNDFVKEMSVQFPH